MSAQAQDYRQAAGAASASPGALMPARAGIGLRAEHYADVLEQISQDQRLNDDTEARLKVALEQALKSFSPEAEQKAS